jgi:hypothetical protein
VAAAVVALRAVAVVVVVELRAEAAAAPADRNQGTSPTFLPSGLVRRQFGTDQAFFSLANKQRFEPT